MERLKKLKNEICLRSYACVGGRKESEGPLGGCFDYIDREDRFGRETWEQSEAEMQLIALNLALHKQKMSAQDLDVMFAGDLLNQCSSSSYGLMNVDVPFLGIFGACSTSSEGLLIASAFLDSGLYQCAAVISSSHFCSAERQFRTPVEYGGQRTPTSQRTVTGAGAFVCERGCGSRVRLREILPGRIVNAGVDDPNNMGAAMAPAALDTISAYFSQSGCSPDDFDLILTGDLGYEGSMILRELSKKSGVPLENHNDCGLLIFDRTRQDVHAGGSGCGCAASVLAGYILPKVASGEYKDVLFTATGALMNADAVKQGLTIPAVAHLVRLSYAEN